MKALLGLLSLLAVIVGAALLLARHERYEWSTDSPRAVAELEQGLEAAGKLYEAEAIRHFDAAIAADPGFAAAKLYLVFYLSRHGDKDPQRIHELLQELEQQDTAGLNERERTLVEFLLARAHGDEEAGALLESYLAEHPDDPNVLDFQCIELAYSTGGGEAVETCLRHLIEVDPNRVAAQNLLAYMAMNRGDFDEAEEQFEIYRFLAPGEANPHDSMGELLMVTGRYDGAEEELRQALALKPDFCPSWQNLVRVQLLRADFAGACTEVDLHRLDCRTDLWSLAADAMWEEAWQHLGPCGLEVRVDGVRGDLTLATFATIAALETGRVAEAQAILHAVGDDPGGRSAQSPLAHSLAGLIDLASGRPEEAGTRFRRVDHSLMWGNGMGIDRLANRLQYAAALAAADDPAAERVMADLARVNRSFATAPPLPPLRPVPPPPPPSDAPSAPPTGDSP